MPMAIGPCAFFVSMTWPSSSSHVQPRVAQTQRERARRVERRVDPPALIVHAPVAGEERNNKNVRFRRSTFASVAWYEGAEIDVSVPGLIVTSSGAGPEDGGWPGPVIFQR